MNESIHNSHDKGFKYLFGIKRLFVQLLRSFVLQDWAQRISPEDVELVDKSFILPDFKNKEADLVYKIKMDGNYVYFYLLELQSSVDFQMPYRLLLYMIEIWRTVLKDTRSREAKHKDFKLPVIVPSIPINDKWLINDRDEEGTFIELEIPNDMPTAFVCNCDEVAFNMIERLKSMGIRVPDDASVVGFDNYIYSKISKPQITTVKVNSDAMTALCVECLLGKIKDPDYYIGRKVIVGDLVFRDSVARIDNKKPVL